MKTYTFEVKELLSKIVEVQAESSNDAYKKIKLMHAQEEIILTENDFVGTEIIQLEL